MRGNYRSAGRASLPTTFSLSGVLLAAVAMSLVVVAGVLALAYPVVALAVLTGGAAARVLTSLAGRVRVRSRTSGPAVAVRVPLTDVHVEV